MKRMIMGTVAIAIAIMISANLRAQKNRCEPLPSFVDSLYTYDLNTTSGLWELTFIRTYQYTNDKLTQLTFLNGKNRATIRAWYYSYDNSGNRVYEEQKRLSGSTWINVSKRESDFNFLNQREKMDYYLWRNNSWLLSTSSFYEYQNSRLTREVQQVPVPNGGFIDNTYFLYFYSGNNLYEAHTQRASDGSITGINRYTYNAFGKLTEMVVLEPSANNGTITYIQKLRRVYIYDANQLLREVIFERWENSSWISYSKYIYFRKIDNATKVIICHKGKEICVSKNAIPAFLKQGSTLGRCSTVDGVELSAVAAQNNTIDVFPNPIRSSFTISGVGNELYSITLYNSAGAAVQTLTGNENEITINRGNLPAGIYIINVSSNNSIQTKQVVFE